MASDHFFHADAAIITRLGRQLVARQETALVELVKNAYDADATQVDVSFEDRGTGQASLEIRDDGVGMTYDDLANGFLRLASETKVEFPKSTKYRRTRAGRKGIGRFSTQRLGDRLELTTYAAGEPHTLRLVADWTTFAAGRRLEDVRVQIMELPPGSPGTRLRIEGLHDTWTSGQIRTCWRGVLALQQPFPVAPTIVRGADPGFSVRFLDGGGLFEAENVIADMQSEILDHLPVVIEMAVDDGGHARWRMPKDAFGPTKDWRPIHHLHRDDRAPPAYEHLRDVHMKTYHVILDPTLLPSVVFTRVRDLMSEEGGIRLYRNGFRVTPYGEQEDDWLGLDEAYGRRDFLAPISNRNFFGVIEVTDPDGVLFEEHTSREGLIETDAFRELRELTSSVLITGATEVQVERGRKPRSKSPPPDPAKTAALSEARAALRAAREAAQDAARDGGGPAVLEEVVELTAEAERVVEAQEKRFEEQQAALADEAAMLRLLASIGMTTAEFSHETGMSFEAFRFDLQRVFTVALAARPDDETFATQAERAQAALARLDTLTAYLNATVASRALREIHPVSLSKSVEDFKRGLSAHAATQSAQLEVRTPPFDPLYTRPMHGAEIASVLLNLHTNALKALKRAGGERRILVEADRLSDDVVRIRFSDTGDGIPEANRHDVFEPFFTTRTAPAARSRDVEHAKGTGLGLWIVDQIARNAGGEVEVVHPPHGYATCLEFRVPAELEIA
jgi:signal transduction histidine kinase